MSHETEFMPFEDGNDGGAPDSLGPCCICGGPDTMGIVMLSRRGPIPGRGWGCFQCGLPTDGAVAVLCEPCLELYQQDESLLTQCCCGFPKVGGRIPIAELPEGSFDHDATKHPEMQHEPS